MRRTSQYYHKATRTNERIRRAWVPVFDAGHVDVVFNGHDHCLARTWPLNHDSPVARPSQGTIYYATGRSGKKSYADTGRKDWDCFFDDGRTLPNYVAVRVAGRSTTIQAVRSDGTVVDTFLIDKTRDRIVPADPDIVKSAATRVVVFGRLLAPTVKAERIDERWFLPVTSVLAALGGTVERSGANRFVLKRKSERVRITVHERIATIDGNRFGLTTPPLPGQEGVMIAADDLTLLYGLLASYDTTTDSLLLAPAFGPGN